MKYDPAVNFWFPLNPNKEFTIILITKITKKNEILCSWTNAYGNGCHWIIWLSKRTSHGCLN